MGDVTEHHGYLNVDGRGVYAAIHAPQTAASAYPPVLILQPFGEEKKSAYRLLVRLARALAQRGITCLRLDVSGTGDSPGNHGDATLEDWQQETKAALRCLLSVSDQPCWNVVAARFGALPAAHLLQQPGARTAVFLEPVLSGEDFLRDLERRQRIKDVMAGTADDADGADNADARWSRGEKVDFGGFAVNARLADAIRRFRLEEALAEVPDSVSIAVCRVSGSRRLPPAWERLQNALAPRGGTVAAVRDKPFWGQLEYYESAIIVDYALEALGVAHADTNASAPQ